MPRRARGEDPTHGVIEERDDLKPAGRAAVQVSYEMQVREAIEITQARPQFRPDLNLRQGLSRRDRLQRHPLKPRERRAHDPHRGDR